MIKNFLAKISTMLSIAIIITASLISACSNSKFISQNEEMQLSAKTTQRQELDFKKQRALEFYLSGKINEMKEFYERAILDYQEALEYDPEGSGIYYSLAKCYLNLNRLPQALKNAKFSVNYGPNNPENYILLAQIFDYSFQYDSSIVYYEKAIKLDSTRESVYYLLASRLQRKKPLKAIEIYELILKKFGPSWNVLSQLAELYEQVGSIDKSIETVAKLVEYDPDNAMLKAFYADVLSRAKKFDEAIKIIDELIKSYPDKIEYIEIKARTLFNKKDFKNSAQFYEQIILSNAFSFEDKLRILSSFYLVCQENKEIIDYGLNLSLKLDSLEQNWQSKSLVGEFYLLAQKNEEALKYFDNSLNKGAKDPSIWFRVSNLLIEKQDYDLAIQNLQNALKYFPDNYALNYLLGVGYSQKNNFAEAVKYFKKAANVDDSDYYVFSSLGFCYYQLDKKDTAAYYLEIALKKNHDNVEILGMLALIYNSLKIFDKSDSLYLRALSFDPDNPLLNNNYAYSLSERGVKLEEALERVNKALEIDPENSSYLDTKGWIYYKMNKYEEAKEYIHRSLEKDPNNAIVLDHLGDVYYKLNDIQKAKEYWKKSFSVDSSKTNAKIKYDKGGLCEE